jgi:hypothetical protein
MAKPYWCRNGSGFLMHGNRIHREEIKTINAQLAEGHVGLSALERYARTLYSNNPVINNFNQELTPFKSSILERLHGHTELLQAMAEIALQNVLPDRWNLKGTDGYDELVRDRRLDLIQTIGELTAEASAA